MERVNNFYEAKIFVVFVQKKGFLSFFGALHAQSMAIFIEIIRNGPKSKYLKEFGC